MTIRCRRCGCAKFYFTSPKMEEMRNISHHGACCAGCHKPIDWRDLISAALIIKEYAVSQAE